MTCRVWRDAVDLNYVPIVTLPDLSQTAAMESHLTDISRVIQLAVAPVFLLTAIATMINALNSRLGRIVDRRRVVQERLHTRVDHDAEMAKLEIRMLAQLQQLPAEDFDVAVTSLGVNDVTARRSLTQWQLQQGQFIDLLQTRFRARQIVLSGLPPMHRFPALPQPLRWYVGSRACDFDRALAAHPVSDSAAERN